MNLPKVPLLALFGSVAVAAAGIVWAGPGPGPGEHRGGPHNGAREVDLAQLETRFNEHFAQLDSNSDGVVSIEEFRAAPHRELPPGARRAGANVPGDRPHTMDRQSGKHERRQRGSEGKREQYSAERQQAVFAELDADKNGQVSAEEFSQLRAAMRTTAEKQRFARVDSNKDGSLSKEELGTQLDRMKALDTNGDGKVSRDEMRAARAAARSGDA